MSRIFYLPSFVKQLEKLRGKEAQAAEEALLAFHHFIESGEKTLGWGFKKLSLDKFEIRVDIRNRMIMKKIGEDCYLVLYGNHEEIERFLRNR